MISNLGVAGGAKQGFPCDYRVNRKKRAEFAPDSVWI